MKKIITLLITLCLILSFVGCASRECESCGNVKGVKKVKYKISEDYVLEYYLCKNCRELLDAIYGLKDAFK